MREPTAHTRITRPGASHCACSTDDPLLCAKATDTDGLDPCECWCHLNDDRPYSDFDDDHSAIKCDPRHFGPAKGW